MLTRQQKSEQLDRALNRSYLDPIVMLDERVGWGTKKRCMRVGRTACRYLSNSPSHGSTFKPFDISDHA